MYCIVNVVCETDLRIYTHAICVAARVGLLGSGEEVGVEVVHDNIREQRRSGEVTRTAESQKRRAIRVSDHHPTTGLRQRSQVT